MDLRPIRSNRENLENGCHSAVGECANEFQRRDTASDYRDGTPVGPITDLSTAGARGSG